MKIHESGENYLETILILTRKKGSVRSVDIVSELGYSKSSVSRAVNLLQTGGYISVDNNGEITFTGNGLKRAEEIYERHSVLTGFLTALGVDEETAEKDACRMEHDLSEKTYTVLKEFIKRKNL